MELQRQLAEELTQRQARLWRCRVRLGVSVFFFFLVVCVCVLPTALFGGTCRGVVYSVYLDGQIWDAGGW